MATVGMECKGDDKGAYEQDREKDRGDRKVWAITCPAGQNFSH